MKYITTDKHPELKEGVKIGYYEDQYEIKLSNKTFYAGQPCIDAWLSNGYIKEVEEKEYTKSDMIDFARMYYID
ncbi:unnamed protein product, partial [marine sediment metagenome]